MQNGNNNVSIRGTKEGLTLLLDDQCTFSELLLELEEKLASKYPQVFNGPLVRAKVSVGNRYLTEEQIETLKQVINEKQKIIVDSIEANVISVAEAEEMKRESQINTYTKVIRSGQVLKVKGDLLILGDVNHGATVEASGNIYILGVLRGIAHAGCDGNKRASIYAAKMEPSQLRISNVVSRAPDGTDKAKNEMECAYINSENIISVDRVQNFHRFRFLLK
ncbi:MAG: septum site-determining protein MinC [Bacillaceae bacterium]|nr:septum site-determining protein MinC [Bacillaceae bacterium]